jgi:hypothetical protein
MNKYTIYGISVPPIALRVACIIQQDWPKQHIAEGTVKDFNLSAIILYLKYTSRQYHSLSLCKTNMRTGTTAQ